MTVQDALDIRAALAYRQGARACVNDHSNFRDDCHQCTAWLAVREHLMEHADNDEKALRAAYVAGAKRRRPLLNPSDKRAARYGVAAGIAVLTEGAE